MDSVGRKTNFSLLRPKSFSFRQNMPKGWWKNATKVKDMAEVAKKVPEEKNIWDSTDVKIVYEGNRFVFPSEPEKISYDDIIRIVKRIKESEEQRYDVLEWVHGAPWDALTAVAKAMHQIYGVVIAESIQTFFGEIKPQLITINTGPEADDNIQVAMGQMSLPNITAPVQIGLHRSGTYIKGQVMRKDRDAVVRIAVLARKIMAADSIYKGKAIRLSVDDDGALELTIQPEFIQLKTVLETDMIHTKTTEHDIRTNIFGPLKYTQACRDHKIPLKRGILLEGRYGTGKSLTARVAAKVAVDNGWTFIMLDKSQGLGSAIEFARNYQPCVIFAEDIDRAADREDEAVNTLVNLLDGMITKDMEMMVVLTTNFIDKIDKALLRPGRFDAVISIEVPDGETSIKLMHQYGRDLLDDSVDLTGVGDVIAGQIPATIREVVERAKIVMLMEGRNHLNANDLLYSAIGMKKHIALLEEKKEERTPAEVFYDALRDLIASAANIDVSQFENMASQMNSVRQGQSKLARNVHDQLQETNSFAQAAAGSAEKASEKATLAAAIGKDTLRTAAIDLATTEKVLKVVS
jgi:hypothetical protein